MALRSQLSPIDLGLVIAIMAGGLLTVLRPGSLNWYGVAIFALFDALCLLLAVDQPPALPVDFALIPVLATVLALGTGAALPAIVGGALGAALVGWSLPKLRPDAARQVSCPPRLLVRALSVYTTGALAAGVVYSLLGGTLPLSAGEDSFLLALLAAGAILEVGVAASIVARLALARRANNRASFGIGRLLIAQMSALVLAILAAWPFSVHNDQLPITALMIAVFAAGLVLLAAVARTRAALKQRVNELAAINRVGHIVTSHPFDGSLFEAIHHQIEAFCDAPTFSIALYDETTRELSFPYVSENGRTAQWPSRPLGDDLTAHVIQTRQTLLLGGEIAARTQAIGLALRGTSPACYLGVPLIAGDEVIGVMALEHGANPHAYGRFERELLEAIGLQAAVALRNARLFDEAQSVSAELQELVTSSREFGATLDIPALAASIVRRLHGAGTARATALYGWSPEASALYPLAHFPPEAGDRAQQLLERLGPALIDLITRPQPGAQTFDDGEPTGQVSALALVARERPVGLAILWEDPTAAASPPGSRRLVEGIVHQAAVALQNAQTYSHADASLRERVIELSAIEVISRHMAATLDLETIINDVVAAAMSAIDASLGCCGLVLDDERYMLVAMLDQGGAQLDLPTIGHVSQGLTGRALSDHKPVIARDVQAVPDYVPLFPGMRSELCAPIMREGRPIGMLNFEDPRANAFTEAHMRFVSTLAEHAAIAIENARLFTARRRQIEMLVSLRRISTKLLEASQLEAIAETIVCYVQDTLHARRAHLYWVNAETGADGSQDGAQLACAQDDDCPAPDALLREVAQSGEPYYSVDVSALPIYRAFMPLPDFSARICVPIRRGDRVLAVLDLEIVDSIYYSENEIQALDVIADQAAVAVESIRLNNTVRAGRDQLQAILDSTREGMLLFDLSGRLLRANRAAEEMLEQPLRAVQGRSFLDWLRVQRPTRLQALTGYSLPELRRYLLDVSRDPRHLTRRQFVQQRDSGTRYIDEIGSPVLDERGETVIGWMLVWHDITEERKLDDLRQELSSMIVHDLRSPLTAIISSLTLLDDLLVEDPLDRATLHEVVGIASISSENMLRLVESLLDIARLEQNRIALDLGAYRLHDVVDSAYTSVLSLAIEAGITVETDLPNDLPPVRIDGEQIHRVLVNLLDNALRHTPYEGRVLVEAALASDGDTVCVSVCDSGPGVPADERAVIFEKFAQLDHPILRGHKGSGLGLTFCKLVVQAHGGAIWVDDADFGGAAFHFTLPRADDPMPRRQTASSSGFDAPNQA